MQHRFFALISRMRYIGRWGLMRNTFEENIQEHSHMVAVLAHGMAVMQRDVIGQRADSGGQHRDDDEPPQPRPAARMLCASLHACLLQFLRIFAAAAGFVCGLQLLLLYCNYRAIITFFHDLSSFFLIFLFSSSFLC